jgi:hypothetical protein
VEPVLGQRPRKSRDEAIRHCRPSSVEHHEKSIETLFLEYLGQKHPSVRVPVTSASSSRQLRDIWERGRVPVAFNRFAEDVFAALRYAYDQKYGVWDDVNDLRTLFPHSWHTSMLPYTSSLPSEARILGVGVNDGREIRQLFACRDTILDVVDISPKAIDRLVRQLSDYAQIRSFVGPFEGWTPDFAGYDMFFSLRTLNCTAIDRRTCVRKSIELTKPGGLLIYSVANGYVCLDDGVPKMVNGMFSYATGTIDAHRPREIVAEIAGEVDCAGATVLEMTECPTEIFIVVAKKSASGGTSHGLR